MKTAQPTLQWEKVHVFISSTFNDMHAERDYLVKRVFPELQDWCERRKLRLVDIDLRWGVTEQDATHNKNVVKVCLDRIDLCRPFFLCFLGQRRGWVPKAAEVSVETFTDFPDLRAVVGAASVTEMEILHALIDPFHQSLARKTDKSTEYYERAKYAFFYLRDPSYLDRIPRDPAMLRQTYTNESVEEVAERAAHDAELERWREQEIPESNRPCHLYQANWDPHETTPELMIPLQSPSSEPAKIKRWQTQWQKAGVSVIGDNLTDDQAEANKAAAFNARLSTGRLSDFECEDAPLSRLIIKELQDAIAERFHEHKEVENESELQKEIDQQEQFLFLASEGFIPRTGDFAELDTYVQSDSNQLFVLTAEGGMGKSTLLANWVDRFRQRIDEGTQGHGDHSVHFRFIGQSDGTTSVYSLIRLLLSEIKEIEQKFDQEIPLDPVKLRNQWPALLESIGERGPTVIVIDALNQLESGLSDVGWLPRQLPDNIKLIVSFKRGDEAAEKLYERFSEGNQVKLAEVKPFADLDDRRRLVRAYLSQYLKELDEQHLEAVINLPGAENPLYLKVVLSELRVFGAYGNLTQKIRSDFGDTPVSAFVQVLKRLESDPAYSPIDPRQAVPLLFGLLVHARRGLSVDELTSLFIQNLELDEPARSGADAADTVNLFLRQVRSFLARREGRYDFFFESFKTAVQQCYVVDGDEETISKRSYRQWHLILAQYFKNLPTWIEAASSSRIMPSRQPTRRKVAELPHHLIQAAQWEGVEQTLSDLHFIEAKCCAELLFDLQADYDEALSSWPAYKRYDPFDERDSVFASSWLKESSGPAQTAGRNPSPLPTEVADATPNTKQLIGEKVQPDASDGGSIRIEAFASFVSSQRQALRAQPEETIIIARNHARSGPVVTRAEELCKSLERPWIERRARPLMAPNRSACLHVLEGHTNWIRGLALTHNGRTALSASRDGSIAVWDVKAGRCLRKLDIGGELTTLAMSPDGRIAIVGDDRGKLNILDVNSLVWREIPSPSDHRSIDQVAISADGRLAIYADLECLRVLDATTGATLRTFGSHPSGAVALTPNGKIAVSAYRDNALCVWDVSSGVLLRTLDANQSAAHAIALSEDGSLAVSSGVDSCLDVWDVLSGARIRTLVGHTKAIASVALTPDGRLAVSGAGDHTVRIWDTRSGDCLRILRGHTGAVFRVAVSANGRLAISGGWDKVARVWDVAAPSDHEVNHGHRESVTCLRISADDKQTISASLDGTLRVWDTATTKQRQTLLGHSQMVLSVAVSARAEVAASGSWDRTVGIWDLPSGRSLRVLKLKQRWLPPTLSNTDADFFGTSWVHAVALSPNGRFALSNGSDMRFMKLLFQQEVEEETVRIWDISSGKCLRILRGHSGRVNSIAVSADGRRAVSASDDCTLRVWDLTTGLCVGLLKEHKDPVLDVALAPSGSTAVSSDDRGSLLVWDLTSCQCVSRLFGHSARADSVSFSRDGRLIVSASRAGAVRVWNLFDGRCLAVYSTVAPVLSVTEIGATGQFVCGLQGGEIHWLTLRNIGLELPIVTATRYFSLQITAGAETETRGDARHDAPLFRAGQLIEGQYQKWPSVVCPWCGEEFPVSVTLPELSQGRGAIQPLSQAKKRVLSLIRRLMGRGRNLGRPLHEPGTHHLELTSVPQLELTCPDCGQDMKLNPFCDASSQ